MLRKKQLLMFTKQERAAMKIELVNKLWRDNVKKLLITA